MSHNDEEENIQPAHQKLDLVWKLESFSLRSFIHLYNLELSQITIKTLEVAGKLKADLDRISIIMKPPDKWMKNEQLYKYIVEECDRITASDLLKVLEVTGNTKALDFIHSRLKNVFPSQPQSQSQLQPQPDSTVSPNEIENDNGVRIRFNVLNPPENFNGRAAFLEKLHETIQCVKKETDITILSQFTPTPDPLVNCPSGIGKTETARQYISLYGKHYRNIIWIEAESRFTMENSFTRLAQELGLGISIKNGADEKSQDIKEIVHNVYKKLCEGQTHPETQLIIFDNADYKYQYQSAPLSSFSSSCSPTSFNNNNNNNSGTDNSVSYNNQGALAIQGFLPSSFLPPPLKRPRVLITSRNKVWNSSMGKILMMELNTLTKDEGVDLILNHLGMSSTPTNVKVATTLNCLLGGHPLALKLAVSYLKNEQENTAHASLLLTYSIHNFIQKCKKTVTRLNLKTSEKNSSSSSSPPQPASSPSSTTSSTSSSHSSSSSASFDPIPTSVQITWSIIMEKLETLPHGCMAMQMNEFLTFLYADNIPRDFLLSLLPKSEADSVKKSLKLLKKYGIIDIIKTNSNIKSNLIKNSSKVEESCEYVKIHRLLQYMTLQSMRTTSENVKIQGKLQILTKQFRDVLQNAGELGIHDPIFLSIHQLCIDCPFNLIQETSKFLHFNLKYSRFLRQVEKYEESLQLLKMIEFKRKEILGENHRDTFETQKEIALVILSQEKYDEALIIYEGVEWAEKVHLGLEDPQTICTAYYIALVLRKQKNYARALDEIEQVVQLRNKILGPLHIDTIRAEQEMAYIFFVSGDFVLALKHYETLYVKQCQAFGELHADAVFSKFFLAICLLKHRRFPDALVVFQELHKMFVINFGENHPESLNIAMHLGMALEQQGELKESRKVLKRVYQQQQILYGESHEETMNARDWLLYLDERLHNQMRNGYMQKL